MRKNKIFSAANWSSLSPIVFYWIGSIAQCLRLFTSVISLVCLFQPCLMFVGKPFRCFPKVWPMALPTNIRLSWKHFPVRNIPIQIFYYKYSKSEDVESFIDWVLVSISCAICRALLPAIILGLIIIQL
jgi:hypothetical protein